MTTKLPPEAREAGVGTASARAPETITLGWLQDDCAEKERILRNQYKDGRLPAADEAALARLPPKNTTSALRRWATLKHFYARRSEGLVKSEGIDKAALADAILMREPVTVQLPGRTVEVTSRSYAAMYRMAAHAVRLSALDALADQMAAEAERLHAELEDADGDEQAEALQERIEEQSEQHAAVYMELLAHRRAIYAHAFTDSGAPAEDPTDAPEWWLELDRAADIMLIGALHGAGMGRLAKLGPAPKRKEDGKEPAEDFGWASLFAAWARRGKVAPATYFNADIAQISMAERAADGAGDAEDFLEVL